MDHNAATFSRYHDHDPDTGDENEPDSIESIRCDLAILRESWGVRKPEDIDRALARIDERLAAFGSIEQEASIYRAIRARHAKRPAR